MRTASAVALISCVCIAAVGAGCNRSALEGEATPTPSQPHSDTFSQTSNNGKSDILFVINNTDQTMVAKAATLGSSATGFITYITAHALDFHIAVTSMDMFNPDAPGCTNSPASPNGLSTAPTSASQGCFNACANPSASSGCTGSPQVITNSTPNLLGTFQQILQVGFNGDPTELGLDAALASVTSPLSTGPNASFLRSDARLFIIFVTDEDDNAACPGNPLCLQAFNAASYVSAYAAVKGGNPNNVIISAIAGPMPTGCGGGSQTGTGGDAGTQYNALITASHGLFESVCDTDYTAFLTNLGYQVGTLQASFPLSQVPLNPSTIVVTVNGSVVPSSNWSYDAATNSVVFAPGAVPPAGSSVVITYQV